VLYVPAKSLIQILRNRGNRIKVRFRVKGNLDDPHFNLRETLRPGWPSPWRSPWGFPSLWWAKRWSEAPQEEPEDWWRDSSRWKTFSGRRSRKNDRASAMPLFFKWLFV